MDSDTSYQMLGSNKYVYAENLRITSVNTTNNGNTENAQGEIRPILGVTKCELNGDSEKIDRILACGSIRNYGIIIYTSSDKNPNGTSTWRVGRFINRKPEDLEEIDDEYKKINEVYRDDEFHNLTFTKIFDSRHSTDVKKFSIEFRYEDEDVIKLREIFSFKQTGLTDNGEVIGEFMMHKKIPNVYKKIKYRGIETLKDIFG